MAEIIASITLAEQIASIALLVSIGSVLYMQRAIKLSVQPNLNIDHNFASPEKMCVRVRNDGIGPARIIKLKVPFKNIFKEHNSDNGWKYVSNERKQFRVEFAKYSLKPGDSIIAGNAINLISLKTSGNLGNIEKEVKDFLLFVSDIKFEIKYESFDKKIHEPVSWDGSKKTCLVSSERPL